MLIQGIHNILNKCDALELNFHINYNSSVWKSQLGPYYKYKMIEFKRKPYESISYKLQIKRK